MAFKIFFPALPLPCDLTYEHDEVFISSLRSNDTLSRLFAKSKAP
jgi:hypothetical protein